MALLEILICCIFIVITARLLFKNYNPQGVLIISGLLMCFIAAIIGTFSGSSNGDSLNYTYIFDLLKFVEDKFTDSISRLGFMVMAIGGYVTLMNKIKATDAMVYIATKPLSFLKANPYMATVMFIPIGMVLYLAIPSASGLGLLLVSTMYPIMVNLGVSKLTALSIISCITIFDMGPGSANTLRASEIIHMDNIEYFIKSQVPLIIPTTVVIMISYYYTNKYFDKKDLAAGKEIYDTRLNSTEKITVPLAFAILPALPLVFMIVFSKYLGLFNTNITTTVAIFLSMLISMIVLLIYKKNLREMFENFKCFCEGMGKVFSSVVTLIITAEIFSIGLNRLNFIDLLVNGTSYIGLGAAAITIFMAATLFFCTTMMGSGNAAFFSFGPMVPQIANSFGVNVLEMILPIQLCAGMGRAICPIASVNVAIAGTVGASTIDLTKRNLIPMLISSSFLVAWHFVINWH